jgi:hypothetical protein
MTHDRGAAVIFAAAAAAVLAGDLVYAASRWSGSFRLSFLVPVVGVAASAALGLAFRLDRPIGSDRRRARWRQRGLTVTLIIAVLAVLVVSEVLGGNQGGELLGLLAGVAALFTALMAGALINHS